MGATWGHNLMGPREYAKWRKARGLRGTSHVAVLDAIKNDRLPGSSRKEGGRWVIDPDLADREWAANTRDTGSRKLQDECPLATPEVLAELGLLPAPAPPEPPPPAPAPAPAPPLPPPAHPAPRLAPPATGAIPSVVPVDGAGKGAAPSRRRSEDVKMAAEARMKVMDLQVREQSLVEVSKLQPVLIACYLQFHDAIQGLPPRIADAIAAGIGGLDERQRHAVRMILETECDRLTDDLAESKIDVKRI